MPLHTSITALLVANGALEVSEASARLLVRTEARLI